MQVPLLDLKRQHQSLRDRVNAAIQEVVESQRFILGLKVEEFERSITRYCGVKHAIGVASGTDALLLSLRAAGIEKEDVVITTPFTFFATASAIYNAGARLLFVDIDPQTFNIDPREVAKILEQHNEKRNRIKAILPVHLYGQMSDMDPIMEISREQGLIVIEDAAQAIGAEYKGKKAGSIGDLGCFSFFPTKNLGGYGDGGMIVTNDDNLAEKARMFREHGSKTGSYYHHTVGYNSRLDALQAAILNAKLSSLDQWAEGREANAEYYNERLSEITDIVTPMGAQGRTHIYHQYTIRVKASKRDELQRFLEGKGIGTRVYYPLSLHLQECFMSLGYKEGDFPQAERVSKEVLSLPVFPELTQFEKDYVVNMISDFFRCQREGGMK